ncbi:MAG: hypothetical protein LUJ25_00195, partial [Firmicutes bacterium]|nr:hypothetical protein [Bacillota bacterium]
MLQGAANSEDGAQYIETAVAVAAGENHSLALLGENTDDPTLSRAVLAWGENNYGQLGIEVQNEEGEGLTAEEIENGAVTLNQITPEFIYDTDNETYIYDIVAIAAGKYHTVLLEKADNGGRVYAIGLNKNGQLGRKSSDVYISEAIGSESESFEQYVVNSDGDTITDIASIAAGGYNTIAIDSDGNVYNFGANQYGQLGNGTTTDSNTALANTNFTEAGLTAGVGNGSSYVVKTDGYVWTYGLNSDGQLGDLSLVDKSVPVLVGSGAEDVLELTVSAPDEDGIIYTVTKPSMITVSAQQEITVNGANIRNLRGFNLVVEDENITTASSLTYTSSDESIASVSGSVITAVSRGSAVIKATASDGTVGMFVVNVNENASSNDSFYTEPMVAGGDNFSVALKSDGTVWTWGENLSGQLGNGTMGEGTSQYSPVQVVGFDGSGSDELDSIVAIAAGGSHAAALRSDGTVYTWGSNEYGQLGNGHNGIDSVINGDGEETHDAVEYDDTTGIYTIYSAEGLEAIRDDLDGYFVLGANIEIADDGIEPIGSSSEPFEGTFDGNGYRISNLTVSSDFSANLGLTYSGAVSSMFAYNSGVIKNVILADANVSNTTVEITDGSGITSPAYSIAAALVGYNDIEGQIIECGLLSGSVSAYNMTGGIVGFNYGTIQDSYNRASVGISYNSSAVDGGFTGGIAAVNYG